MAATRPRGVEPVIARSATHRRTISAVVVRSHPSSPEQHLSSPEQHPSSPDPVPVVGCCVLVIARFFFNFRTRRRLLRTSRRELWTRRRVLPPIVARCGPVVGHCGPVVARCIPVVAHRGPVVVRCTTRCRDPSRARPAL